MRLHCRLMKGRHVTDTWMIDDLRRSIHPSLLRPRDLALKRNNDERE